MSPPSMTGFYKIHLRPKMMYFWHNWIGAAQTPPACLHIIHKRLDVVVGDGLFSTLQCCFHRRNVARLSLLHRDSQGKYSDKIHSLIPPVQMFTSMTRHAIYHSHSHCISLIGST